MAFDAAQHELVRSGRHGGAIDSAAAELATSLEHEILSNPELQNIAKHVGDLMQDLRSRSKKSHGTALAAATKAAAEGPEPASKKAKHGSPEKTPGGSSASTDVSHSQADAVAVKKVFTKAELGQGSNDASASKYVQARKLLLRSQAKLLTAWASRFASGF